VEPKGVPRGAEDHLRFFSHLWLTTNYSKEEKYLKSQISQILECRTPQEMARTFGWLCSIKLSSLLDVDTEVEEVKPFYVRNIITCSSLILPTRFYLKSALHSSATWLSYTKFVQTCALELGLPHLLSAIEAETDLAKIHRMYSDEEEQKEYVGSALEAAFPDFLWSDFMDGLCGSETANHWRQRRWVIEDPTTVRRILRWICTADMEKIAGIFSLYLINSCTTLLRQSIKEASFNLFQRAMRGQTEAPSRQDEFLELLGSVLPDALCMEFAKAEGTAKKLADVEDLVAKIKESAIDVMRKNHSLGKRTTARTIEKIHRMKVSIGMPQMDSLPKAEYFADSLIHTIFSIRQARVDHEFRKVGKPVDRNTISYPCHVVNASYYEDLNHIVIPWGILQCPFYCDDAPLGWNYGGIGATIAHEITHAFDLDGSHYNERAKHREWWTRKDREHFKSRTRKIGKFFTKFKHYGVHLDGDQTLSENWADFGGLIIALDALKKEAAKGTDTKEPIKTFFTSYAVSWRDTIRKKKALYSIEKSVHSLAEDRVDRIVPHFQDWVDVFNIKESDKLYLPVRDRLKFF